MALSSLIYDEILKSYGQEKADSTALKIFMETMLEKESRKFDISIEEYPSTLKDGMLDL